MKANNNTVLSLIQPTGVPHIGNKFGALDNWVELQGNYSCIFGIADLHALTITRSPKELHRNTEEMIVSLLACGINPEQSILFVQSRVPEHTALHWILECICAYGDLKRQTQFKEKSRQLKEKEDSFLSVGLFTYPVLQASDILIYRAQYVPVGKDQEQHLELSRRIAQKFNKTYGYTFPEPQVLSTPTPKIRSLVDPSKKMSKSLGPKHYVGIFEDDETIRKKIRSAVTDSGKNDENQYGEGVKNLIEILRACGKSDEADLFDKRFCAGDRSYDKLKIAVTDALIEIISPIRDRRSELIDDKKRIVLMVEKMCEQARAIARETINIVQDKVGLF